MDVANRFLKAASGNRVLAATNLATALMEGEAEKFKAGYTQDNAVLAATDAFDLNDAEVEMMDAILGARV